VDAFFTLTITSETDEFDSDGDFDLVYHSLENFQLKIFENLN